MDTTVLGTILITAGASLAALSPQASEATLFLVLPLLGALLVMAGAILLNPDIETRKIVMGRTLFGGTLGVPSPWAFCSFLSYTGLENLRGFFELPPLLFLTGVVATFVAYILSYPFCRQSYERAGRIAKRELDRIERRTAPRDSREDEP